MTVEQLYIKKFYNRTAGFFLQTKLGSVTLTLFLEGVSLIVFFFYRNKIFLNNNVYVEKLVISKFDWVADLSSSE